MADAHDNLSHKSLTYPFNLMSRHPVLAVPSGRAGNGVPTGVQIVGQTFDEPTVLRVGAAIERLLPWSYPDLQPEWSEPVPSARETSPRRLQQES